MGYVRFFANISNKVNPVITGQTGFVDRVSSELSLTITYTNNKTEAIYRDGAFLNPFLASTLDLTTGAYVVSRIGGFPTDGEVFVDDSLAGTRPLIAFSVTAPKNANPKTIIQTVRLGHGGYVAPATAAAASLARVGPVCWDMLAMPDLTRQVADTPPPGTPGWWNVYYADGVTTAGGQLDAFIQAYIAAGGREPQFFAIDQEQSPTLYAVGDVANRLAIWNDVRSAYFIGLLPPGISYANASNIFAQGYEWTNGAWGAYSRAINRAWWDTARTYFPNVELSEYASLYRTLAEATALFSISGLPDYALYYPGTHTSPEMYGHIYNANALYYGETPFCLVRYETNIMRSGKRSSTLTPIKPWIIAPEDTYSEYSKDPRFLIEVIRHLCLNAADSFLYYNNNIISTPAGDALIDNTIYELQQIFGNKDRTALRIATTESLTTPYILSGMQDGDGVSHWRVTLPPGVSNATVDGNPYSVTPGECGFWYTRNDTITPVVVVSQIDAGFRTTWKQGDAIFEADAYTLDGGTGKILHFVDKNDSSHFLTQATGAMQSAAPVAEALLNNQLTATFSTGIGDYTSSRNADAWKFLQTANACAFIVGIEATGNGIWITTLSGGNGFTLSEGAFLTSEVQYAATPHTVNIARPGAGTAFEADYTQDPGIFANSLLHRNDGTQALIPIPAGVNVAGSSLILAPQSIPLNAKIAGLYIYQRALTPTDITLIRQYISAKFGLVFA